MSTSKLQRQVSELLSVHLGQYTIRENKRPDWLITTSGTRLELDFYIEELQAAIEVQGNQHYTYVPHFHGDYDGFRAQLERDRIKAELCQENGIALYEVGSNDDALDTIEKLLQEPIGDQLQIHCTPEFFRIYNKKASKRLRSIFKILQLDKRDITETEVNILKKNLLGLEQHQESKGKIDFEYTERMMLQVANDVVGMYE